MFQAIKQKLLIYNKKILYYLYNSKKIIYTNYKKLFFKYTTNSNIFLLLITITLLNYYTY